MAQRLEDLELYQDCLDFEDKIWNLVDQWNWFQKDTVGKQLVRSADSVSSNIAEGYGRFFYKENRLFCYYSRGSLLETRNWVVKAKRRNMISEELGEQLIAESEVLHKRLNAYIKSIGRQ